jgi:hypothetical protein
MIGKQDVLDRATEWQLRPEVVEKDYILGWILAALASPPEMRVGWFLKAGLHGRYNVGRQGFCSFTRTILNLRRMSSGARLLGGFGNE